jgi:coproporphyrinogen III oxidase-like Fe-S oxidoreductase
MNPWELQAYLDWGAQGFPENRVEWDELDGEARLCEALSLGLRQSDGIEPVRLRDDFGVWWPESVWARWEKTGCLERMDGAVRLTDEGWPLLDEVCVDLLAKARPLVGATRESPLRGGGPMPRKSVSV